MKFNSQCNAKKSFKITGKHVLAMWLVMFGTIISVNLFMVTMAIDSFPGVIVKNAHIKPGNK